MLCFKPSHRGTVRKVYMIACVSSLYNEIINVVFNFPPTL